MGSGADSAGRPAPYGRACANCARAKCKCILRNNGGNCERCFRLKKECTPSLTVRKKRSRPSYTSQTARLEQKLDGLVSLLKAGSSRSSGPYDIPLPSSSSSSPAAAAALAGELVNGNDENNNIQPNNGHDNQTSPTTNNDHQQQHQQCQNLGPLAQASTSSSSSSFPYTLPRDVEPSPEEAEYYFQIYCRKHLSFLPFVHFGEDMTSKRLLQERPFLWLCVMAVSSTDVAQQNAIGRTVREIAAREVIVEGKETIDLLLGLLCFIGWGYSQCSMGPLLTVFSHLCTALTLDLELQKHPPRDDNISHISPRCMPPYFHSKIRPPEPRNIEHRRTALACYFLTSSAATLHSRVESLSWSPYLEECLKVLEDAKESPGDDLLVYLIKFQRITSKATTVRVQTRDAETEESTRIIGPYVSSLNGQLAAVKSQMPAHLVTNKILQTMAFHTECIINELVLMRVQRVPISTDMDVQTMDSLFTCLGAVKSWIDTVLQFEAADYVGLPLFLWKQFRAIILILIRMASLEDAAWDVNLVRRTVDPPAVFDQIASNLKHLENMAGWKSHAQENVFSKSIKQINVLKSWFLSVYKNDAGAVTDTRTSSSSIPPDPLPTTTVDGVQQQHQQQAAAAEAAVAQQTQFPGMDLSLPSDEDLWNGDVFGWWPHLFSE